MIKLNLLAVTLMIEVRKPAYSAKNHEHSLRLQELHGQNLDRRTTLHPYI